MKAISLWQPWATLMAVHAKTIETRHWATNYRGELAIHAAKRMVKGELEEYWNDDAFRSALLPETIGKGSLADSLPFGAIVCVLEVYDCKSTEELIEKLRHYALCEALFGNFEAGRFGWMTKNPRKLRSPVPTRGFQGFWDLPADVETQVRAQL